MIDINKEYETRDGREVGLLSVIEGRVIGWYRQPLTDEIHANMWSAETGKDYHGDSPFDLIPKKKSGEAWMNVYATGYCTGHSTRYTADARGAGDRIARIRVPWEEGQFDE